MATTTPSITPDENDDRAANAAQGRQTGGVVGQTAGKPTYGSGGYELNLDAEPLEDGGSASASSSTEKSSREQPANDKE
ncbi:hypothetical protein FY528_17900 [Hymenobacter lutimineralis]|uniref:Uncharacterized protein n=1 Tax=Hymenobacter lutimineralis TaxID=2606448 RepID=A0A5D6UTY5_9BACT|nr:hypothetical protein [Hymenobacter lutimineralis]TYZ06560.1 hypothetical protein FY528_17900 [Hymenobacter lutimineralis]